MPSPTSRIVIQLSCKFQLSACKLKTLVGTLNLKDASKECTISLTESVLNILVARTSFVKVLSVASPKSPLPCKVLFPVRSVWRLLVVSQPSFCEDTAELWVTL